MSLQLQRFGLGVVTALAPLCALFGVYQLIAAAGVDFPLLGPGDAGTQLMFGIPMVFSGTYAFWHSRRVLRRLDSRQHEEEERARHEAIRRAAFGEPKAL